MREVSSEIQPSLQSADGTVILVVDGWRVHLIARCGMTAVSHYAAQ